jgi:hypothetical protein
LNPATLRHPMIGCGTDCSRRPTGSSEQWRRPPRGFEREHRAHDERRPVPRAQRRAAPRGWRPRPQAERSTGTVQVSVNTRVLMSRNTRPVSILAGVPSTGQAQARVRGRALHELPREVGLVAGDDGLSFTVPTIVHSDPHGCMSMQFADRPQLGRSGRIRTPDPVAAPGPGRRPVSDDLTHDGRSGLAVPPRLKPPQNEGISPLRPPAATSGTSAPRRPVV